MLNKRAICTPTFHHRNNLLKSKRSQLTIFIIIAIIIVAGAITIFLLRDKLFNSALNPEFSEVYDFFDNCVEQKTLQGLSIAGFQGGYIEVPEFEPGSEYAPFSSQLNFLETPVPYWYYVSGNGIIKEQAPPLNLIESQLEDFLEQEVISCDFSKFRKQGILIDTEKPKINVDIRNNEVRVSVAMDLNVEKDDSKSKKSSHEIIVDSRFGEFYNTAKNIYNKEKEQSFLENYAVDVMYNYAPVTGVEISCTPEIWKGQEVVNDLKTGLSANIGALKVNGDYYDLNDKNDKYFVVDIDSDSAVRFLYDKSWPSKIEVWPAENSLLIAEPVGLDKGMGIIGFCYVPYHFVYDIYFPVLIQIYSGDEVFQFPVSVVIDKSVPRQALQGQKIGEDLDELCDYRNTKVNLYTYDNEWNGIEADIDFVCMNARCDMGQTKISGIDSVLSTEFPQCLNGKIIAKAEGFVIEEYTISTNEPTTANILMDKLYEKDLRLIVNGQEFTKGLAVISFEGEENSVTVVYPEQKKILLSEDYYNVSVQVYSDASLTIPASSSRQCVDVPSGGFLGGLFGKTNEECFDINLPSQKIENGLVAGGKISKYILESDLKIGNRLEISAPSLPRPNSLEQLQKNYELLELNKLGVNFR